MTTVRGALNVAMRQARVVLFALGLCSPMLVIMGCDKKPDQAAITKIEPPDFSVTVTLSEKAQAKLRESKATIIVYGRFADEIGPEEIALGEVEYELREPGTVHFKDIQFPQDKINALRSPDYEVFVSVASGNPDKHINRLACDLLHDRISVIQRKSFTIECVEQRINAVDR